MKSRKIKKDKNEYYQAIINIDGYVNYSMIYIST